MSTEETKRGPGRPRKSAVAVIEIRNTLPISVQNCLHGRSSELLKIIQELKGKLDPLEKELAAAEEELQSIQEFLAAHDVPANEYSVEDDEE